MNRYLFGGLLSVLALVGVAGSDIPNNLMNWMLGQPPETNSTATAANVPPLERAGQLIQRQAPVSAAQTLGSGATQQANNVPASDNTVPSQSTTAQPNAGNQPPFTDPATVPGTGNFSTTAQVNSQPAPVTPTTNQSLDSIPALW